MEPKARHSRALTFAAALAVAAVACAHTSDVALDPSAIHRVGRAAFSTERLPGEHGPSTRKGAPATPKVTADFRGAPPTNDWWSSLLWAFDDGPYSRPMFPHPLAVQAEAQGLGVGYPSDAVIGPRSYRYPYARDLRISVAGLNAPDTRVASSSEWAVTASWEDDKHALRATFGHGLPFVYANARGGAARIELDKEPVVAIDHGEAVAITVNAHTYGLFAPTGATWKRDGAALVSDLAGKDFFSVAVLPDAKPETFALFRVHAYAFVTSTRATWQFDAKAAKVTSRFEVTSSVVEAGEGRLAEPLLALYPHQWKATHAALLPASQGYVSPRGAMRLVAGASFDVVRPFHGVLPVLPESDDESARNEVESLVHDAASASDLFPVGLDGVKDTYWAGKSLGKVSQLAWLAHELHDADMETRLVGALEHELESWFDGAPPNRFDYDAKWRTLIGYPAGYQSGTELNDHHFHYGYFVWAAATVAALDPAWERGGWQPIVDLLIRDVANTDATDARFPRLRSFDPYAGHSWASGAAMFDEGNNEESSSEDLNFAAALVLWGSVTGDAKARDLGAFLYETGVSTVEQYWMDVDHDVFPKGFTHPVAGIVWGDGVKYDTWWDRNPIYAHGINMLPFTGASLYLGRHPEAVSAGYEHLLKENRGPVHQWRDVLWMDLALTDPARAQAFIKDDHYFAVEFGNSWANVNSWVGALAAFGHVDASVLADTDSYAVFKRDRTRTYAAFNPGAAPLHVTFTDGATLDVPSHALRHASRAVP